MTIESANRLIIASLSESYDEREAASVSSLVMERLTGMPKGLRLLHKTDSFTPEQREKFQQWLKELIACRPVQYVLNEAWFGSIPFYVDENVLVPRPETEELVNWLLEENIGRESGLTVLDIGTGSGCIPVYIKKRREDFRISALDISEKALEIAKMNSRKHNVDIDFFLCDITDPIQREKINFTDLIISNPPYIPEKQKEALDKHVKDFEPSLALFVPDDEPILFYKIIGDLATQKLRPGGAIFLEIHHNHAKEVMEWYKQKGFGVILKRDLSGNNRMIKVFYR
jgi:release factor glutamine methyltransferase